MENLIESELHNNIGRTVRLKLSSGSDIVGRLTHVTPEFARLVSGDTNPCRVTVALEAVDATLIFERPKPQE